MENLLTNPWIIGIGTTIIAALLLYYIFGIGKEKKPGKSFHPSNTNVNAGRDIIIGNREDVKDDEQMRRKNILNKLHHEYILSNDGISSAMLAGLENPPKEWINKRLKELDENWRI